MNDSRKVFPLLVYLPPLLVFGAFSSATCYCQDISVGLKFEVASIRPVNFSSASYAAGFAEGAARSPCVLGKVSVSGTLVILTRVGVCDIIRIAYDVKSFQVFGIPSALGYSRQEKQQPVSNQLSGLPVREVSSSFYDIQARSPGTQQPSAEQFREMLRALLAERFNLKLHRERRNLELYALVPLAGGAKLKPARTNCKPLRSSDFVRFCGFSMEQLAHFLNDKADRPVVDMTQRSDKCDIEIPLDSDSYDLSAVVASIRKNLGLNIEARRDSIEVLVVDHVEQPSAN